MALALWHFLSTFVFEVRRCFVFGEMPWVDCYVESFTTHLLATMLPRKLNLRTLQQSQHQEKIDVVDRDR